MQFFDKLYTILTSTVWYMSLKNGSKDSKNQCLLKRHVLKCIMMDIYHLILTRTSYDYFQMLEKCFQFFWRKSSWSKSSVTLSSSVKYSHCLRSHQTMVLLKSTTTLRRYFRKLLHSPGIENGDRPWWSTFFSIHEYLWDYWRSWLTMIDFQDGQRFWPTWKFFHCCFTCILLGTMEIGNFAQIPNFWMAI